MIRQLSGTVVDTDENQVVVEVNQIGYLVFTNNVKLVPGDNVTFYTHLAVRETALDLYGFSSKEELRVFELLLDLPKIGPKSALQILSQSDISLLQQAVSTQDSSYLTKMSGIGKKSAEKIVLGLKDKLDNLVASDETVAIPKSINQSSDTIDALVSLGYSASEAREAVARVSNQAPELEDAKDVLKEALRQLN